jgi:hypothetical protein
VAYAGIIDRCYGSAYIDIINNFEIAAVRPDPPFYHKPFKRMLSNQLKHSRVWMRSVGIKWYMS